MLDYVVAMFAEFHAVLLCIMERKRDINEAPNQIVCLIFFIEKYVRQRRWSHEYAYVSLPRRHEHLTKQMLSKLKVYLKFSWEIRNASDKYEH